MKINKSQSMVEELSAIEKVCKEESSYPLDQTPLSFQGLRTNWLSS